eukprot:TRINITY_DN5137_c0_g1_i1.p1 TRINITY_DN5137_c0_g1~~TRINITY_DN5137_c0_g1_i1.p1  ORF type:complete len:359 (-),score=52.32 TRINITY_DN5137_c0_g1_i1:168-1244(-)
MLELWNLCILNILGFLGNLPLSLGFKCKEDWYSLTFADIKEQGGAGLLALNYDGSVSRALMHVYPSQEWLPWKFNVAPHSYWEDKVSRRNYFNWIGNMLKISRFEDWYQYTKLDIAKVGSVAVLGYYDYSLGVALSDLYPEYPWRLWEFHRTPRGYWDTQTDLKELIDLFSKELGIQQLDDWYRVSKKLIAQWNASINHLIREKGGLYNILKEAYPQHNWDKEKLKYAGKKKSNQWWLFKTIKEIFPDSIVLEDYQTNEVEIGGTGSLVQFDVYVPEHKLALEYQGYHHYHDHYMYGPAKEYKRRDSHKKESCKRVGITLVAVPYWWELDKESVIACIHQQRPELVPDPGVPPLLTDI